MVAIDGSGGREGRRPELVADSGWMTPPSTGVACNFGILDSRRSNNGEKDQWLILISRRHPRFEATESDVGASKMYKEPLMEKPEAVVRARLLRMNAHDYGNYNPTPSLSKPRYKLIPN
ncbi:hypothetical protein AKJ16_DCAP16311 [Drosera capensis]